MAGERVQSCACTVNLSLMKSMARITVARLGVEQEKNNVASFKTCADGIMLMMSQWSTDCLHYLPWGHHSTALQLSILIHSIHSFEAHSACLPLGCWLPCNTQVWTSTYHKLSSSMLSHCNAWFYLMLSVSGAVFTRQARWWLMSWQPWKQFSKASDFCNL